MSSSVPRFFPVCLVHFRSSSFASIFWSTLFQRSSLPLGSPGMSSFSACFSPSPFFLLPTFLPLLDYGDLLYTSASGQCLRSLDAVTVPYDLSLVVNILPTILLCMQNLMGRLCLYLDWSLLTCVHISLRHCHYSLCLQDVLQLSVPRARTELAGCPLCLEHPPEKLKIARADFIWCL